LLDAYIYLADDEMPSSITFYYSLWEFQVTNSQTFELNG
jgi:hypothetical protein